MDGNQAYEKYSASLDICEMWSTVKDTKQLNNH